MTTLTLLAISIVLAIAAGILANALRNRDKELEAMAESYNSLRDKLTQTQTERDQAKADAKQADRLRDECEKTMRAAMEENDRMMTERANLYFRNSKGQIAKLHP
jgi:septal ring factor EnvC (AmiA/AmiB activator)